MSDGSFAAQGLLGAALMILGAQAAFAQNATPDFSSNNTGWTGMGGMTAMPGSPEPTGQEPSRPLIGNIGRQPGQQPTFPYADLANQNLTPFAKESLKKVNEAADAGFAMYSLESRCWHTGVPLYLNTGDDRFDLDAGVDNERWESLAPLNSLGPNVEWRLHGGRPVAIIYRLIPSPEAEAAPVDRMRMMRQVWRGRR